MLNKLILASTSPFRQKMLSDAGLAFDAVKPDMDERTAEAPLKASGASPGDVALVLAEAKAIDVSERYPDALVLGCDQTLSLGDELLHKPEDMEAARRRLLHLSGKTHERNSAVCVCYLIAGQNIVYSALRASPISVANNLAKIAPVFVRASLDVTDAYKPGNVPTLADSLFYRRSVYKHLLDSI